MDNLSLKLSRHAKINGQVTRTGVNICLSQVIFVDHPRYSTKFRSIFETRSHEVYLSNLYNDRRPEYTATIKCNKMHRNVWQYLFRPRHKKCFKTDTKNRSIVKRRVLFLGEIKTHSQRAAFGNGFRADQESHNIRNLLDDLFSLFMEHRHEDFFYFAKKKVPKNSVSKKSKPIKATERLTNPNIYGISHRDMIETNVSPLNHDGIPCNRNKLLYKIVARILTFANIINAYLRL